MLITYIIGGNKQHPNNQIMITKTTTPIINKDNTNVVGSLVEYRLFGILIIKKKTLMPNYYGVEYYDNYSTRI